LAARVARRQLDRAARAERLGLDDVADADAEGRAVAEHLFDAAWLVVEAQDHLVDFRRLPEEIDLILQEWPIENRHDGFGRVQREWAESRAFSAGEQDGLHVNRTS